MNVKSAKLFDDEGWVEDGFKLKRPHISGRVFDISQTVLALELLPG